MAGKCKPSAETKGYQMRIEHLAIWVADLELMRSFYERYFEATAGEKYHNATKNFTSYFLTFKGGPRLELMQKPGLPSIPNGAQEYLGINHFAVSVGSREKVNALTEQFKTDGHSVVGEPRTTGDGYYESVVLDPEGNRIEITI
jgi:lactoylglutathione lyase